MLPIKHIVYPIDFSERCLEAAPFVAGLAQRYGADVTLLAVIQPTAWADAATPGAAYFVDPETLRTSVQERLDGILQREFAGISVNRAAVLGDPAGIIVEFARRLNGSMIAMPSHGYGPFRRMLLGSVTSKVLHDTPCPVWTGAHTELPATHSAARVQHVLCAVDRDPVKCAAVAKWAVEFAKDEGASIRFVHAVPAVEAWPEHQLDMEFQAVLSKQAREEIEKTLKDLGIEAAVCVVAGDIPGAIREEARRHEADVVIIGRGVLHETFGRIRTHTHAILRESPCPVISV